MQAREIWKKLKKYEKLIKVAWKYLSEIESETEIESVFIKMRQVAPGSLHLHLHVIILR